MSTTQAGVVTQYTYDNNGNTLSQFQTAGNLILSTWDFQNRLSGQVVTDSSGTHRSAYQYDTEGNRVAASKDGQETRYLVDTNRQFAQVVEEYTPGGLLQASYVQGLRLISQNRGGAASFYLADALGSTRALTDATGAVTDGYMYDAFGELLSHTGTAVNEFLFAGQQLNGGNGQYYLRARYYDPATGRFTATDSLEGRPRDPRTLNRYVYAAADPVNLADFSGHEFDFASVAAVVSVVGILAAFGQSFPSDSQGLSTIGVLGASLSLVSLRVPVTYSGPSPLSSTVITASQLSELGAQQGTVVLGHYTRPIIIAGRQLGVQDTLQILDAAAHQLGGRTLSTLSPDLAAIAPELDSATRIVFFTSPGIRGLTLAELNLIQSNEALLGKTIFVYGGF